MKLSGEKAYIHFHSWVDEVKELRETKLIDVSSTILLFHRKSCRHRAISTALIFIVI